MSILLKDLEIEIPFKIQKILSVKIVQKCNEHAVATIDVMLEDGQKVEDIYSLNEKTNVVLHQKGNDKKLILFSGVLMDLQISMIQDICIVSLTAKSNSILLDIKKKRRSFQHTENKYQSLFEQIIKTEYQGDFIDTASNGKTQDRVIIQYDETDWAFLLRLASQLHTIMIPDIFSDKPKLYIGLPNGETYKEQAQHYRIIRKTEKYMIQNQNFDEKSLLDFTYFKIETEHNYELGDTILYRDFYFIVIEKEMVLQHGKMICYYQLCKKEGVFTNTFYNAVFMGLSIDGKVLDVKKDCLKLHLCIDETQDIAKCYWFPYNTLYATEGQTGYYSMPQVGDSVKLYSPKTDESQMYVRLVNRTDGKQNTKTQDISTKRFGNIHKKEMVLSPTTIDFVASEQKCAVNMDYSSGVTLTGSAGIQINTANLMRLEANKIVFQATDRIMATTPKANVIVDEIMHFKA